jgi:hypothetical protein
MAAIAVARSATSRKDVATEAVDTQAETPFDAAGRAEVDVLARALCAVSMCSSLTDSLMCFYSALEPADARKRTALVLERMQKILPDDLAEDLSEASGYDRPWSSHPDSNAEEEQERSLMMRFALPAVYLVGATILGLSVVGSITMLHYLHLLRN